METSGVTNSSNAVAMSNALGKAGMGKEDFLKLLIAQMQNQDPLSPMENHEYASQLAQFSSLEQLQSVNSNLEQGVEINLILTQAINNTMASTMVGKEVKALGNSLHLAPRDGEDAPNADIAFALSGSAESVTIEIKDENGRVVRTLRSSDGDFNFSDGDNSIEWDGMVDSGNGLVEGDEGSYTFSVTAEDGSGDPVSATTYTTGRIEGVRYDSGMAMLIINGEEVPFSAVLEVS